MNRKININFDNLILTGIAFAAIGVAVSYANLYLFHIWFLLISILWLIKIKEAKYLYQIHARYSYHTIFLLFMFLWYTISIMWAPDIIFGLKYLFYIFCGIIITSAIIQFSQSISRLNTLYKILSFIFIFEIVLALLESSTSIRWPISPYSTWSTFFGKEPLDLISFNNPLIFSDFRPPTGFHWNTNNLAITMVIILPFFLCTKRLSIKIIGSLSVTIITIFSGSRAVFIALITVYTLYLLIIKKKISTISLVWILIGSLFLGMNILSESNNPRINELANSFKALELFLKGDIDIGGSIEWRRKLIDDGINSLIGSNGLGVGAGGSTALQEEIGGVAGRFTSMHNFWIELLVEGGIVFGVLGLIWYSNIIYNLFIVSKNKTSRDLKFYSESLILSMFAFIPSAVAASSTIYFFPMWIMIGMAISTISLNRKNSLIIKS